MSVLTGIMGSGERETEMEDLPRSAYVTGLVCPHCGVRQPIRGKSAPDAVCAERLRELAAKFWAEFWKYERKQS
jgi:hypothetical protein